MGKAAIGARRSTLEIVLDILSLCSRDAVNKTRIMYGTNLSYAQLVRYLDFVTRYGLIELDGDGDYVLTRTGWGTLQQLESVIGLIRQLQLVEEGGDSNGA